MAAHSSYLFLSLSSIMAASAESILTNVRAGSHELRMQSRLHNKQPVGRTFQLAWMSSFDVYELAHEKKSVTSRHGSRCTETATTSSSKIAGSRRWSSQSPKRTGRGIFSAPGVNVVKRIYLGVR
ncbi:hypothetical protein LZ31DRAFT_234067 [Colletotrichum somersetense]|nr:hypothetical protein LZ31DRAFT_234067 [Colletotrichum somersetense]